jgi:asparagine synthase (glutamine-hydrolysing)
MECARTWIGTATLLEGYAPVNRLFVTVADGMATLQGPLRATSADGRYVVVLEGELDADRLLAAFAEQGPTCFNRLIGPFVCAVHDSGTRRLTLARDHFGMKSLYYSRQSARLEFGSAIGLLLPGLPARRADPMGLRDYLVDGLTDHATHTMFAEIHSIPPAHYVAIELSQPHVLAPMAYWQPILTNEVATSLPLAAERLRELFLESVGRSQDPEVGTTLSGGTDTSAIVMALRHHRGPAAEIHTFSYIGEDGATSEEPWIDAVNDAARAVGHKLRLTPEEWTADFENLVEIQGEPFGTIAVSAQHRLYRLAASAGSGVLLGGAGADELLGGHAAARLASLIRRGAWIPAVGLARRGTRPWHTLARAAAMALPDPMRTGLFRMAQRRPWINWEWLRARGADPAGPWWIAESGKWMLRGLLWRLVQRGLPAVLRYEDRNATAAGMTARFPFLTPALSELVFSLPESHVISDDGRGKAVFRAAMRGLVPDAVLDRRDKIGFSVPLQSWTLKLPAIAELLDAVQQIPALDTRGVAPLLATVRANRLLPLRESFVVWRLVGLAAWARRFNVTFA